MKVYVQVFLIALMLLPVLLASSAAADERPNILWIFAEDTSPWMGCYGDKVNADATPNIDSIAASGVMFARAFVPAPVCSACRSAMMAGQSQIRFGAHEHRSSRGNAEIHLPKGMKLLPQIMKQNGYYSFNWGKTDYNFVWEQDDVYSDAKVKGNFTKFDGLKNHQPFFGQIQTRGGKHNTAKFPTERKVDPASVTVPADYPQNQIYRETVAQHYDAIRKDDDHIGEILQGLQDSGMADKTIVVYFSDHGANNLVRHKQMPTEGGLHVPFVIKGPAKFVPKQGVRNELVNMLDLTATTLAWAGIEQPEWYEGQNLFAANFKPRTKIASAKDRLDHTLDRVRTIRTERFRYTRNYKLDRILLQPQYRDSRPFLINLHQLYATGKLSPKLSEIYFGERPAEELYDVSIDPAQVNNLVGNDQLLDELDRHRSLLDEWLAVGDMGAGEESIEEMKYNADDKKWGEGVNPEYEVFRKDDDGDGLSSKWETVNGRDPGDGRLLFEFDCGGWQTEGWKSKNIQSNIAGSLGYLDFEMDNQTCTILREQLSVNVSTKDESFVLRLRASDDVNVKLFANDNQIGETGVVAKSKNFRDLVIPLGNDSNWNGTIKSLRIEFGGKLSTDVEIDAIFVNRDQ